MQKSSSTVQDLINARVPQALNVSSTDPRFYSIVNQATQRVLWRGKYWGTMATYRIAVTSQIMALPPYLDTVEAAAVSLNPIPIRDFLYQFLHNGWGVRDTTIASGTGVWEALYQGNFPTALPIATAGVLTAKCDLASDVGKTVTILGYDDNGNWIRTNPGGVWQDGENVLLAQGAGTNTVNKYSIVSAIQAPSTLNGQWWLYVATVLLGNYQYWDTKPSWKRYLIPFVDSTNTFVDVAGKKAFIPVSKPTDYLAVGNVHAVKLACMAVRAEEETQFALANILWNGGVDKKSGIKMVGVIDELEMELNHQQGDGRELTIDVKPMPGFEPLDILV